MKLEKEINDLVLDIFTEAASSRKNKK